MKQIEVHAFCDSPAHADREQVPATVERVLTIDQYGPGVLDLCAPCDEAFNYWRAVIREAPDPPEKKRSYPKGRASRRTDIDDGTSEFERTCQEPDCAYGAAPTRSALGQHVKSRHGKALADYDWTQ